MNLSTRFNKTLLCFSLLVALSGCGGGSDDPDPSENLDRQPILINWVDNIVVPSYDAFKVKLDGMADRAETFIAEPTQESLVQLRAAWVDAYISWETVELFEFGPADDVTLRFFMNIYPTDVAGIASNIDNPTVNLGLPANYARQGFPALDYLINGVAATDEEIVAWYTAEAKRVDYLQKLVNRMSALVTSVIDGWEEERETFITKTGLDIGSSVGLVVNAYVLYFERYVRSGKVGIPSGAAVASAGIAHPEKIESYYKRDISKELLATAHLAVQNFFNGQHAVNDTEGPSFRSYLDALDARDDVSGKLLSEIIDDQFDEIETHIDGLSADLYDQIEKDNQKMKDTHTEMQALVAMLKVDMTSAMSVTITYTDNDGD